MFNSLILCARLTYWIRRSMECSEFRAFIYRAVDILSIFTDLWSSFGASGPKNQVFDIKLKVATIFVGTETLSRLFMFRSISEPDDSSTEDRGL